MDDKRLGFLSTSSIIAGILTVLIIIGLGLTLGNALFSPGQLNAQTGSILGGVSSHADLSRICSACHAPFWKGASMSDRCLVCHTDVSTQQQDPTSLHGLLYQDSSTLACRTCHPDHQGLDNPLTDMLVVQFPHGLVGFSLAVHQNKTDNTPFVCQDCHTQGYEQFDQSVCLTCHRQYQAGFIQSHLQTFGDTCFACHDGIDTYGHGFDHNTVVFQLSGKHAQASCDQCHQNARTLTDLRAAPTDCASCHLKDNPHSERLGSDCASCHTPEDWTNAAFDHDLASFKLEGNHVGVPCESCHVNNVFRGTPGDCYSCHTGDDIHIGQYGTDCSLCHKVTGWTPASFDHNLFAFQLTGKHTTVVCTSCHVNDIFKGTPSDCVACHASANPHSSRLGSDCVSCHTTDGWLPATFDHNLAAFQLTGKHVQVACTSCHVNNVYRGTPTSCYSCHADNDKHNGQFGTDCAACHTSSGWLPATFDHNLSSFKLTGQHTGVACTSCHANGVFKGTPANCNSCHANNDKHNGQYGANCAACHTTNGWLPASFSHGGFPLTNGHAGLACTRCHTSGQYAGLSTSCSSCHAEPAYHAGLFGTNCAQCHTTSNWNATYTGSHPAISIRHHGASCSTCHPNSLSTYTCLACHNSNNPGGD